MFIFQDFKCSWLSKYKVYDKKWQGGDIYYISIDFRNYYHSYMSCKLYLHTWTVKESISMKSAFTIFHPWHYVVIHKSILLKRINDIYIYIQFKNKKTKWHPIVLEISWWGIHQTIHKLWNFENRNTKCWRFKCF